MDTVVLINPPLCYQNGKPSVIDVSYPPLGILYLAGVLEKNKIKVIVLDIGAIKQDLSETIKVIKNKKPLFVGISSMTPNLQGVVTLAKEIKKETKTKICIGGPHASADPDIINRIKFFDYAICGEGEQAIIELVKNIKKRKKIEKIIKGQAVTNLDQIPFPARHLVNQKQYLKIASLITSRGCPYNCYYCSRPAIDNHVRCRSPKLIVKEMNSMYTFCKGNYIFQDDTFTINRQNTINLCNELIKQKKKYKWECLTRVELVDDELLKLMSKAGCRNITFGIESGDEKIRNEIIGKHFSNESILKAVNLCNKYKINPNGFFMFSHPTETKKEVQKTIDFILNNKFNIVGVSISTPFPGSKLWIHAVKEKIIDLKFIDDFALGKAGLGYLGNYPVYIPKTLKKEWVYLQRRKMMRKFYLRPQNILKRISKDITSPNYIWRDIKEFVNLALKGSSARAPYQKIYNKKNESK